MDTANELGPVRRRLGDLEEAVLKGAASAAEVREYVLLGAAYAASLGIEQPSLLTVADIADHFTELTGRTVAPELVQSWRNRNSPNRTPEEIAKAPSCPEPAMQAGVRRPVDVWLEGQLPQWDTWYLEERPGQGKGGGRPRG
jgi:hypothetical protein